LLKSHKRLEFANEHGIFSSRATDTRNNHYEFVCSSLQAAVYKQQYSTSTCLAAATRGATPRKRAAATRGATPRKRAAALWC
jgi:hypothetical protein